MKNLIPLLVRIAIIVVVASFFPAFLCGLDAPHFYDGEEERVIGLAREVAESITSGVGTADFSTGSPRFDGEWALGTYQMAALGLSQVVLAHPELHEELRPALDVCLRQLSRPIV